MLDSNGISALAAAGSVLVAIVAIEAQRRKDVRDAAAEASRAASDTNSRITAIEVKIDVFWTGLMKDAATILHQPHPEYARRDELLELLLADEITEDQVEELRAMLHRVVGSPETVGDQGEQLAASILLRLLDTHNNY